MNILTDRTALIIFKEGTEAIKEFGFYMYGCIQELGRLRVPADIFDGKESIKVLKVMDSAGKLFNIPCNFIQRIKYI
jgi:hypothetical protein